MKCYINPKRNRVKIDKKIYGHFVEHFHRQIYGGIYDPESKFADADGFRTDVLEAMRNIKIPILRWLGGCFVSSYDWKKGVGKNRTACFDKSWRVEEPNLFGTDEYINLCSKIGCEPYICTNAGTGTAEQMSDWVEYCNLENEGEYAKWRIENGNKAPYNVKYWSIGNENYGCWEIGAKDAYEWSRLVEESAKMMLHITPELELSTAALTNAEWNFELLKRNGHHLKWISIHNYWDRLHSEYNPSSYEAVIEKTSEVGKSIYTIRGTLAMLGLDKKINIAYDEWNLRAWHHPYMHTKQTEGTTKEKYLYPRDKNDINSTYTMADAVFAACFLNECIRNCDIVKMANFAPIVNTTGAIFTHDEGIVKRSTYYIFELMTHYMGDVCVDFRIDDMPKEIINENTINMIDIAAAVRTNDGAITVCAVNKYDNKEVEMEIPFNSNDYKAVTVYTVNGKNKDDFNDINSEKITMSKQEVKICGTGAQIQLRAHSVNIIEIK